MAAEYWRVLGPTCQIMFPAMVSRCLYIGAFVSLIWLKHLSLALLQTIQFPKVSLISHQAPKADPLSVIVKAPNFIGVVFAGWLLAAVMNILMTAKHHWRWLAADSILLKQLVCDWVRQRWLYVCALHSLRVLPSSSPRMMILAGGVLFVVSIAINNIHGVSIWHFRAALVAWCGLWNFMSVSLQNLVYSANKISSKMKAKAQAFNEFVVFGCVTVTALLSGWLESTVGWQYQCLRFTVRFGRNFVSHSVRKSRPSLCNGSSNGGSATVTGIKALLSRTATQKPYQIGRAFAYGLNNNRFL